MTFAVRFCADRGCPPEAFESSVLRLCMAAHARPFFALVPHSSFFAADRELVRAVETAISMTDVRNAIDDYWSHPANRTWWRRVARFRVSTQHLRRIAHDYLPFALPKMGPPSPP